MSEYVVENLPAPIFPECTKIAKIRDRIHKGEDMLMIEKDEKQDRRDEHQDENYTLINASSKQQNNQPRYTKNIEALYFLTEQIQQKIDFVNEPPFNGKIRHDSNIRDNIQRFFNNGIDNYADDLVIYIESLIIDDGFNASLFHGYTRIVKMIKESHGMTKKKYLLALMNKTRQIIPPNIATKPVHVIEPSISKSSNPSDA